MKSLLYWLLLIGTFWLGMGFGEFRCMKYIKVYTGRNSDDTKHYIILTSKHDQKQIMITKEAYENFMQVGTNETEKAER